MQHSVRRITPAIGAVLEGVSLAAPLTDDLRATIIDAVHDHHVVFIRNQHLNSEQFSALARCFGELMSHPLDDLLGRDRPTAFIEDTEAHPPAGFAWHSDLSWLAAPPSWGFLRAVDVPDCGGDTLWASGIELYRRVTEQTRRGWWDLLTLVHAPDQSLVASIRRHHGDAVAERFVCHHPPIGHPLVRAHAITSMPILALSPLSTTQLRGIINPVEAANLLQRLNEAINEPQVQVRWHWQAGDIAIWDETSTVHRALPDHAPQYRRMERCTLRGSTPIPHRLEKSAQG
jgi:taurine dioxygenase